MIIIDHIYISILIRSTHVRINQNFSVIVAQQQRAREHEFPYSQISPHVMSVYWDRAKAQPELLITLNNLQLFNNIKIYHNIFNVWSKDKLALL